MPVARRGTPPTSQIKEHKSVLTSLSAWTDTGEDDEKKDKKKKGYQKLGDDKPGFAAQWLDPEADNFNIIVGVVILANAVSIGLETEFGDGQFKVLEHVFNGIFFLEMVLRLRAFGKSYFTEPWNIFDFSLVCFGTLDLWILPLLPLGDDTDADSPNLLYRFSVMRMLRILRLMRILRVVRLFRMFQQLYLIMQAFNKAFQIVLLMGLLVLILDYVCAIMLTQAIGHHSHYWDDLEDRAMIKGWFGGIPQSMQTLFVIMTLSDWDNISFVLVKVVPPFAVYTGLVLYIMVTSYTMLSLITGIISESLITAQQEYRVRKEQTMGEKKKELQYDLRSTLLDLLEDDKDNDNNVPPQELKQVVRGDTDLLMKLAAIGVNIDEHGISSLVEKLSNEEQTLCNVDYFVDKLTNLNGQATASSIMDLKFELAKMHSKVDLVVEKLQKRQQK